MRQPTRWRKKKKELSMLCAIFWMVYRFSLFGKKKKFYNTRENEPSLCGWCEWDTNLFLWTLVGATNFTARLPFEFFWLSFLWFAGCSFFFFYYWPKMPFSPFFAAQYSQHFINLHTHLERQGWSAVVIRIEVSESWKRKSLQSCIF